MPVAHSTPAYHYMPRADTNATAEPLQFSSSYTSTTLTSIIACAVPMIALMFLAGISWVYRYSVQKPRPINKASGYRLQRFAPLFYILLVLTSLAELAISTWLVIQYNYQDNYPNLAALLAVRVLLFTSCWTIITASVASFLFIHPDWSRQPISSIGSQALWIFITWILWILSAGLLNAAVPSLLVKRSCANIVYCGQIRSLFALGVIQSLLLSCGMFVLMWLAWQSTRDILRPVDTPTK
ncbi:hypothetical protein AGABI1DRAFT_75535 [Agaricus bisporus var. burnettii JB137-S8]|uniref:MARVEL domain-containing protein n=2 Tax=Agaricus bisporus var. burnettii TaxID=192524 RepID=K5X7J8_AGABU|nr:uncharacterized protein AGABI1DRAFT_75535 [Agaricus bisporus var. burnettii JB137-S8]EKM78962.1 hypothetical protein AGABI1DRAFT_75535 [Agaricus bisporus var. burnettii JB137-S8]KAF7771677.1 hypothetical protein Agabi119p4_5988 [Agaricus bisporus var. burnettii]